MRRNQLKLEADGYTYRSVGSQVFIVTTPEDREYRVDLERGECSCRSFFCGRRPCKHLKFFEKLQAMEMGVMRILCTSAVASDSKKRTVKPASPPCVMDVEDIYPSLLDADPKSVTITTVTPVIVMSVLFRT